MKSFLPNGENQTLINSELFFQKDGERRPRSMGYPDSFTYAPEIETAEKDSVGPGGAIITTATATKKTGANVTLVLSETVARNVAMALQGDLVSVTQEAGTIEINETDVLPGEYIDLGAYNITDVALTDGVDPLVEGVDYLVNSEAGGIMSGVSAHGTDQAD